MFLLSAIPRKKVIGAKDCATATKPGLPAICERERAKKRKNERGDGRHAQRYSKTDTVLKELQDKQREQDDRKLQSDKDHVLPFEHKGWCQ